MKAREEGRVTNVACVVATAVSADGHREVLGLDTFTAEEGGPGPGFCAILLPGDSRESSWSSLTTTKGWWEPSPLCCPAPPGRDAGPIS